MEVFGPQWKGHAQQVASHWKSLIHPEDLVLVPGDLSWAMRVDEVVPDLQWVHDLPGTKVMIKGNHDYWWGSLNKITPILPPSIHLIQNNAVAAICYFTRNFNPAVNRPWMHDNDLLSKCIQPVLG